MPVAGARQIGESRDGAMLRDLVPTP